MTRRLLLVEGNDDRHSIRHLCLRNGIDFDTAIDLQVTDGKNPLLETIPIQVKSLRPGDALAIVIDADENVLSTWQALRDRLAAAGYLVLPVVPNPDGTTMTPGLWLPKAGVWLMPDNSTTGVLEDFMTTLIPPDDRLLPLALDSVERVEATGRQFNAAHRSKAVIHTWLAWQEEPGTPMGAALNKRYLDPDRPLAVAFMDWLRSTLSL